MKSIVNDLRKRNVKKTLNTSVLFITFLFVAVQLPAQKDVANTTVKSEKNDFANARLTGKNIPFRTKTENFYKDNNSIAIKTAIKTNDSSNLASFINSDNVNNPIISGETPLFYALHEKSDPSVINFLLSQGADPNYFAKYYNKNNLVYKTPLAIASINADKDVVSALIEAGAQLYPPTITKAEKKRNAWFLADALKDKPEILALLRNNNYDLDYGSSGIKNIAENMVLVEGGKFTLGCLAEQGADCPTDELPKVPSLNINTFYLSKYEVTQAQWQAVMGSNPSHFSGCENCPVEMVGWNEVQDFIKKLNEMTGKHYRLPTELEWEFAAKEGTKSAMHIYSGSNDIDSVAWYGNNSDGTTHEVGSKKPNALGLYDLSGNVFELCSSFYTDDLTQYQNASTGITHGAHRVLRGGSWRYFKREAHVSYRINSTGKTYEAGFRLAMDK